MASDPTGEYCYIHTSWYAPTCTICNPALAAARAAKRSNYVENKSTKPAPTPVPAPSYNEYFDTIDEAAINFVLLLVPIQLTIARNMEQQLIQSKSTEK